MPDIVFAPYRASYDGSDGLERLRDIKSWSSIGELEGWTCKKTAQRGDLYLFYFGAPVFSVVAIGVHTGVVAADDNDGSADWTKSPVLWFGDFKPFVILKRPVTKDWLESEARTSHWWAGHPYQGKPNTILDNNPAAAHALLSEIAGQNPRTRKLLKTYLEIAAIKSSGAGKKTSQEAKPRKPTPDALTRLMRKLDSQDQKRLIVEVKRLKREQSLRPFVLGAWGTSCAVCGLELEADDGLYEVEVAHIQEVQRQGTDSPRNALPLCRTHHWAFDQHLWAIDPKSGSICVSKAFRVTPPLKGFHGKKLRRKKGSKVVLDSEAVRSRWKLFRQAETKRS